PVMFLEEMLLAAFVRQIGGFAPRDVQDMLASGPAQPILHVSALGIVLTPAGQRCGAIRFVVQRPRQPGDRALRHELAHEHHAALAAMPCVESQIQFSEVAVPRPGHAEYARIEELEGDETDEGVPVPRVQFQARRQTRLQQRGRDGVGGEEQVAPLGGEEWSLHGCAPWDEYTHLPYGPPTYAVR